MTRARVIGLGQRAAGDDGVGLVVLERLGPLVPPDVELVAIAEACAAIPLLATPVPVVVVDAVVTDRGVPGEVLDLDREALRRHARGVSTHGVSLAQALDLARWLAEPERIVPTTRIIGVTIAVPHVRAIGLSDVVEAAVPHAVGAVLRTLGEWLAVDA